MTDQSTGDELREQDASRDTATESGIDVVLVTGLSGAGRGTAAKVLEDLGWYVADNLPPELIARMVDLGLAAGSRITQLAVVMDVRSRGLTAAWTGCVRIWLPATSHRGCCFWRRPTTFWCAATNRTVAVTRCRATRPSPRASPPSARGWRRYGRLRT